MTLTRGTAIVVVGLLVAGLVIVPRTGESAAAPVKRTIYMAAIEPRGGTQASSEAFPTTPLPGGPGYVLTPTNAAGRWEVSAYMWQPGFVVANEGEDVTLEIIGLNGAEHPSFIEGINVPAFTVRRGQITNVNFRASRPGFYRIVCGNHLPNMIGYLVVLPRR
jgi:plastocyanin